MGWAARANRSQHEATAAGFRKLARETPATRHDARVSRIPIAALVMAAFGLSPRPARKV